MLMRLAFILMAVSLLSNCSQVQKPSKFEKKQVTESLKKTIMVGSESDVKNAGDLESVYFDFKSSNMGIHLNSTLEKDADILLSDKNLMIRIEGNADERGSKQLNLALGEKRANYVKQFLIEKGINPSRLTTISLGKEHPLAFGHNEESWALNRRVNFVVIGN